MNLNLKKLKTILECISTWWHICSSRKTLISFLPISPSNFDKIFNTLDIDCAKLSGNVNWKTYCSYLVAVEDVRNALAEHYVEEGNISPLDAHSYLWIHRYIDYPVGDVCVETKEPDYRQTDKYREAVSKARIGQGKYRKDMIDIWGGRCAVTDCAKTSILRASHAKPWGDVTATADEVIDPYNGFLLSLT